MKLRVYQSPRVAIEKYHRLGAMNNRNLFPHSSGGRKSRIKVLASLVSPEASLLGLQVIPSHCVLTWPFP